MSGTVQTIITHHTPTDGNIPALLYAGEVATGTGPNFTRMWLGDGTANRLMLSNNPTDLPVFGHYLPLTGGQMTGQIQLLPPTAAVDAVNKDYVDSLVASLSLFVGTWQVAANTPPLTGAESAGDYYIAVTANPNNPENAPGGIPGIGGQSINNGDIVIWSAASSIYELIRGGPLNVAEANAFYVQLTGDQMTGPFLLAGNATAPLGAVPLQQLNSSLVNYLPLTGGTLTGPLLLSGLATTDPGNIGQIYTLGGVLLASLAPPATNAAGATINIQAQKGDGTGRGGGLVLSSGDAGPGGGGGGNIFLSVGAPGSAGAGGTLNLTAGRSNSGIGGALNITAGNSNTSTGGALTISSGAGSGAGNGGPATITGGTGNTGGTVNVTGGTGSTAPGGTVNVTGGLGSGASAAGGNVAIAGGGTNIGASANGGNVTVQGGIGGGTGGPGGNVTIQPGATRTASASNGNVTISAPVPGGGGNRGSLNLVMTNFSGLYIVSLPTVDPGALNAIWSNNGVLQFSGTTGNFLPLSGGTLTGDLLLAADPTTALGAATKEYVDNAVAGGPYLPISGGQMAGQIELLPPTGPQDAVNKNYVDTAVAALMNFVGTWQVASNTPSLVPPVAGITNGDYFIATTVDPNVGETPPGGVPISPAVTVVYNGDYLIWDAAGGVWDYLRGSPLSKQEADALYLALTGGTLTGPLTIGDPVNNNALIITPGPANSNAISLSQSYTGVSGGVPVMNLRMALNIQPDPPPAGSGLSGLVTSLRGGPGDGNASGGPVGIYGANAPGTGTGIGGAITISAGTSGITRTANSANVTITAGGGGQGAGGAVNITGGRANTNSTGVGGAITISAAQGAAGSPGSAGGVVSIFGGAGAGTGAGGNLSIGAGGGAGGSNGGNVNITAGASTGQGGNLTLTPGTSGASPGNLIINNLRTVDPGVTNAVWSNNGLLQMSGTAGGNYLPLTGGTLTGDLALTNPANAPRRALTLDGGPNQGRIVLTSTSNTAAYNSVSFWNPTQAAGYGLFLGANAGSVYIGASTAVGGSTGGQLLTVGTATGVTVSSTTAITWAPLPTLPGHLTNKSYVDTTVASETLYQGTWNPATNVPPLMTPAPLDAYSWIVSPAPQGGVVVGAAIPGLQGQTVYTGDHVVYNSGLSLFQIVRAGDLSYSEGIATFLQLAGGTVTGPINWIGPPTAATNLTTKAYVDQAIAGTALFQGTWDVIANSPPLQFVSPLNGYYWIAANTGTADPAIPGIGGQVVTSGDMVIYEQIGARFVVIAAGGITQVQADARYLQLSGGAITGPFSVGGGFSVTTNGINYGTPNAVAFFWDGAFLSATVDGGILPGPMASANWVANGYLPLAGGTLTGPVAIALPNIGATNHLSLDAGSGAGTPAINFQFAGTTRWRLDATGSQFRIVINDTGGALVAYGLTFNSAGLATVAGDPTAGLGIASKQYVDGQVATRLPLNGGTLTGALGINGGGLVMGTGTVVQLAADPTTNLQAATKQYVDNHTGIAGGPFLPLAGGTITGVLNTNAMVNANAAICLTGNIDILTAGPWAQQGGYMTWNHPSGNGEVDIINSVGLGGGGFQFSNVASTNGATPTVIANLNGNGLVLNTQNIDLNPPAGVDGFIYMKRSAGNSAVFMGQTGNSVRWMFIIANSDPESGSNAGSNVVLNRFSDTGAYLGTALAVNRANGAVGVGVTPPAGQGQPSAATGGGQMFAGGITATNYGNNLYFDGTQWRFLNGGGRDANLMQIGGVNPSDIPFYWEHASGVGHNAGDQANLNSIMYLGAAGDLHIAGALSQGSDARLKYNIADTDRGLAAVLGMRPRSYTRIGGGHEIGLIAQELREVLPEAVSEMKDDMLAISPMMVVTALVNAVTELTARLKTLEERTIH